VGDRAGPLVAGASRRERIGVPAPWRAL